MPTSPAGPPENTPDPQLREILNLIRIKGSVSRTDIARTLGIAPSTAALRVTELESTGLIEEFGEGTSSGGRRPRLLRLREDHGVLAVVEIGGTHARIGYADLSGSLIGQSTVSIDIASGPIATLRLIATNLQELLQQVAPESVLHGVGVALPGPVSAATGGVDLASRMPGWQSFSVRDWFAKELSVPTFVDNDANLMALGEHHAQLAATEHSVTVKVGTAIGSGVVIAGSLYRGATGAAGDVTHTRIAAATDIPCSCGNTGCLETLASGAGLVRQLRAEGFDVHSTADVVALTHDANPTVTTLVRTAGTYLGDVLSPVVNFFNPTALFLSGGMASCEPFIAAVRGRIYEGCHPLATRDLRIEAASTGPDAALLGAARIALEGTLFSPISIPAEP
ncbi:N-acetylmannosamine kinase [Leucobacter sp. BZR 635]